MNPITRQERNDFQRITDRPVYGGEANFNMPTKWFLLSCLRVWLCLCNCLVRCEKNQMHELIIVQIET